MKNTLLFFGMLFLIFNFQGQVLAQDNIDIKAAEADLLRLINNKNKESQIYFSGKGLLTFLENGNREAHMCGYRMPDIKYGERGKYYDISLIGSSCKNIEVHNNACINPKYDSDFSKRYLNISLPKKTSKNKIRLLEKRLKQWSGYYSKTRSDQNDFILIKPDNESCTRLENDLLSLSSSIQISEGNLIFLNQKQLALSEIDHAYFSDSKTVLLQSHKYGNMKWEVELDNKYKEDDKLLIESKFVQLGSLHKQRTTFFADMDKTVPIQVSPYLDQLTPEITKAYETLKLYFGDNMQWFSPDTISIKYRDEKTGFSESYLDIPLVDLPEKLLFDASEIKIDFLKKYKKKDENKIVHWQRDYQKSSPQPYIIENNEKVFFKTLHFQGGNFVFENMPSSKDEEQQINKAFNLLVDYYSDWEKKKEVNIIFNEFMNRFSNLEEQAKLSSFPIKLEQPSFSSNEMYFVLSYKYQFPNNTEILLSGFDDLEQIVRNTPLADLAKLYSHIETYKKLSIEKKYDLAQIALEWALRITPQNYYLLEEKMKNTFNQGNRNRAKETLAICLSKDYQQKFGIVYFALIKGLFDNNPELEMLEDYLTTLEKSDNNQKKAGLYIFYEMLVDKAFKKKDLEKVIFYGEKSLEYTVYEKNPSIAGKLAYAYLSENKFDETLEYIPEYRKQKLIKEDLAWSYVIEGAAYAGKYQFTKSSKAFKEAEELDTEGKLDKMISHAKSVANMHRSARDMKNRRNSPDDLGEALGALFVAGAIIVTSLLDSDSGGGNSSSRNSNKQPPIQKCNCGEKVVYKRGSYYSERAGKYLSDDFDRACTILCH